MTGRGRWLVALVAVAGAAAAVSMLFQRDEFALPRDIPLEHLVADLSGTLARPAVVAEPAPDAVHIGGAKPGWDIEVLGGYRRGLVVPPPSRLRFTVRVPEDARMRFGIAVQGSGKRVRGVAGVRFAVDVDGREAFARTVNPAATRHDRRWFDEEVALGGSARDVELVLRTERDGDTNAPLAGTPVWAPVRVVHEERRPRHSGSPQAPNVVVVLVDTLRADHLGCYGATPSVTPVFDRLAAEGLVFEQMVSQSSWTMPVVATLFTGLYPRSHGVVGRSQAEMADDRNGPDRKFLPDALRTLPELVQDTGITTVGVSANPLVTRATNLARGFETFVETGWDRKRKNWTPAAEVNDAFLRWLGRNRELRFFAYLHYMEPHDPYTPPVEVRPAPPAGIPAEIAAGNVESVAERINWKNGPPLRPMELDHLRRLYALEVSSWDTALGNLLAGLDAAHVRDSTVVVVLGDHGEAFQEHGRLKHGIHLYDELLRVPLIIAGPGVPRARIAEQAETIDLLPTIAAILGAQVPAGLPGRDLRGARPPRPAFAETRQGIARDGRPAELVAVRSEGWKLIHAPGLGTYELYDLRADPHEHDDRYGRAPEGDRLAALLAAWTATVPPPPAASGRDPGMAEKLRALGYVQ
jgi:arylsulfatase A-like enzyme